MVTNPKKYNHYYVLYKKKRVLQTFSSSVQAQTKIYAQELALKLFANQLLFSKKKTVISLMPYK